MNVRSSLVCVMAAAACWIAGSARVGASDPVGVYAVIEKVVVEPAEGQPDRIQVWGVFALAETRNNDDYGAPQKGYLYYSCVPQQIATCRNEWADLQSVAGKGTGVGFGGRHIANGRVRSAADKPESPDPYPIRMGVFKTEGRAYQPPIIQKLKAALATR